MSEKKIKFKWLEKIKNIKHIEIIVIGIFLVVLLLIYFSTPKSKSGSSSSTNQDSQLTITRYVDNLEKDLENTISQIKGVGNVQVLITLDMTGATIEDDVIKTSSFPKIKGIVIVASGVDNTSVKMNVLRAVEAVVDISTGSVEILSSN